MTDQETKEVERYALSRRGKIVYWIIAIPLGIVSITSQGGTGSGEGIAYLAGTMFGAFIGLYLIYLLVRRIFGKQVTKTIRVA